MQTIFRNIAAYESDYVGSIRVRELSNINSARILLELGDVSAAIDAYQSVKRESPYFAEALFELAWAYLIGAEDKGNDIDRSKEYEKARRSFDILLKRELHYDFTPQARLIFANILLKMHSYDKAKESFEEFTKEKQLMSKKLKDAVIDLANLSSKSIDMIDRTDELMTVFYSSDLHSKQVEEHLNRSRNIEKNWKQSEQWSNESLKLIEDFLHILNSDRKVRLFPELRRFQVNLSELAMRLQYLGESIMLVERELLFPKLRANLQKGLTKVLKLRRDLRPSFERLIQEQRYHGSQPILTIEANKLLRKQSSQFTRGIEEISRKIKDIFPIEERESQNVSHGVLLRAFRTDGHFVADTGTPLKMEREEIKHDERLYGISTLKDSKVSEMSSIYFATMKIEREILSTGNQILKEQFPVVFESIREQRSLMDNYLTKLTQLENTIERKIKEKASALKVQLSKAKQQFQNYREVVDDGRRHTNTVIKEFVRDYLVNYQGRVNELIIRGDVGIIDVAWGIKQTQAKEISRKLKKQSDQLSVLEDEWANVLE